MGFTIESKETHDYTGLSYQGLTCSFRGHIRGIQKFTESETIKYRVTALAYFYYDRTKKPIMVLRKMYSIDIDPEDLSSNHFLGLYEVAKTDFAETTDI